MSEQCWLLQQTSYKKEHHSFYETLFALSNGYIGVRNIIESESIYSIPGTFFADVYDSGIAVPTEIVNAPSWLPIKFFIQGSPIHFDYVDILHFERILDMRQGIVYVALRFQDQRGFRTRLEWITLVHAQDSHLGLIWGNLVPENYSGNVSIASYLDYRIGNSYMGGYLPQVQTKHCMPIKVEADTNSHLYLEIRTIASNIHVAEATRLTVDDPATRHIVYERERLGEHVEIAVEQGKAYSFAKYVTFYTSLDTEHWQQDCQQSLRGYLQQSWRELAASHFQGWKARWELADVHIDGDDKAQQSLRFGIFHLLQSAHPAKKSINIPARGLTSEYHSGHFFFNTELFKLQYFIYLDPEMARSLLKFRYRTLEAAKQHASSKGYHGAFFPEESDYLGNLASPQTITNYFTGETFEEWSGREVKHLSADVAYGIYRYFAATNDLSFMLDYGLELLVETARFAASLLEWDKVKQAFIIRRVMGIDEYHYHVDNHYYTNYMIKWNIMYTLEMLDSLSKLDQRRTEELLQRTHLSQAESEVWGSMLDLIYLPRSLDGALIDQFEGYLTLPDERVEAFDENQRPVLDVADAQQANYLENFQTRLIKQGDVIMLMSLFRDHFSFEQKQKNFEFYEARTVHESSLSATSYGLIANDIGELDKAYTYFLQSARYNLDFIPKANYRNGIHIASYAGAWQIVVQGFAGVIPSNGILCINPHLPSFWKTLSFQLHWQGNLLGFTIEHTSIQVEVLTQREDCNDILLRIEERTVILNRTTPRLHIVRNHQSQLSIDRHHTFLN